MISGIDKVNAVTAAVERKSRVSDGAGGFTETWREVDTVAGRIIRITRQSRENYQMAGAGSLSVIPLVLALEPDADIQVNDRVTVGATVYNVEGVRRYMRSTQADVRAVV